MKNEVILGEKLKLLKVQDWCDWIEDILNYGVANPVSRLSADGDIIVDMVQYLTTNKISTYPYEQALCAVLKKLSKENKKEILRLVEGITFLKGMHGNETLISIYTSKAYAKDTSPPRIKTKVLLALSRSSFLEENQKSEIESYSEVYGFNELCNDPSYFGNYLRFNYLQKDLFFQTFFKIVKFLTHNNFKIQAAIERYVTVIADKLQEFHYYRSGLFYSSFTTNLLEYNNYSTNQNYLLDQILKKSINIIEKDHEALSISGAYNSGTKEIFYGNLLYFILSLRLKFKNEMFKIEDFIVSVAELIAVENAIKVDLKKLFIEERDFLFQCYDIAPYISEIVLNSFDNKTINEVIDMFDIMNAPRRISNFIEIDIGPAAGIEYLRRQKQLQYGQNESKMNYNEFFNELLGTAHQ